MYLILLWILVSLTPVESAPYTFPMNSNGGSHAREVKIGVILTHTLGKQNLPKLPFAREMVMPAIVHAVEKLQNDPQSVLPGVKFTFTEKDSNCSNSNGPLAAIDLYRTKMAHVFMGPACDYAAAPIARYSGRWGIPVVTAGALFQGFSDKQQFPLLTRVQGSFHKVKEMFASVLDHFNWTRIGMLFYEDVNHLGGEKRECLQILRPIYEMFTKEPPPYYNVKPAEFVDWRKHVASLSNNSRSE